MKKILKFIKNNLIYEIVFILIIILILFFHFYDTKDEVTLKIGNEEYTFSKEDETHEIDLITLNSEYDTYIENIGNLEAIKINEKRLFLKTNLGKLDLNKQNTITISIKFNGEKDYTDYTVNTFPSNFMEYETSGESPTKGDFYLTTYGSRTNNPYIYKIDNKGKLLFYRRAYRSPYIFKKEATKSGTYYTYLDLSDKNDKKSDLCLNILDEHYNLIDTIANYDKDGNQITIDEHDYIFIDKNQYILNTDIDKYIIHEIKDGKILWEYTYQDYEKEYTPSEKGYHFNSFEIDTDNNLLVSFRATSEIVKINRKTGKIMWILGGKNNQFDKEIFFYQHAITKANDTYIVYSNNAETFNVESNPEEADNSTLISFKLDEKNKKITDYQSYELNLTSYLMGGAFPSDYEKNIHVLTYGFTNSNNPHFAEINLTNDKVLFKFNYKDNISFVFRVYKF